MMRVRSISMAAVALLTCAVAMGQPAPRGPAVLADYLQLTPDQIAAWREIGRETAAAIEPLADNARDLRQQLDSAMNSSSPDPAAVGKLALSLHAVRDQIRTARDAAKSKQRALLTPEQRTKFDAFEAAVTFRARSAATIRRSRR